MPKTVVPTTAVPLTPEIMSGKITASTVPATVKEVIKTATVDELKEYRVQLKAYDKSVRVDHKQDENISLAAKLHKALIAARDVFLKPVDEAITLIDRELGARELAARQLQIEENRKATELQEQEREKVLNASQAKITKALAASGKVEEQITQMKALITEDTSDEERTLIQRQIEVLCLKLDNFQEKALDIQKTAERAVEALPVAAPSFGGGYTRTKGVSVATVPEVVDKLALIKLVAEGKAPESLLDVNLSALKNCVKLGIKFPVDVVKLTEDAKYKGRG